MHERQLHEESSFLSLTYSDENLPAGGTLKKNDFQAFMKRLRKSIEPKKIRFFQCGEYGDDNLRPHYHAILFGHEFPDKLVVGKNDEGDPLYESAALNFLWRQGRVWIGAVTRKSAAYVARYVLKKLNGEPARLKYARVDPSTGELFQVIPEYITMSLRPGIGSTWFEKYKTDVYPDDYIVAEGKKIKVPAFYDKLLEKEDPTTLENCKGKRRARGQQKEIDNTPERLRVREIVKLETIKNLKRKL